MNAELAARLLSGPKVNRRKEAAAGLVEGGGGEDSGDDIDNMEGGQQARGITAKTAKTAIIVMTLIFFLCSIFYIIIVRIDL